MSDERIESGVGGETSPPPAVPRGERNVSPSTSRGSAGTGLGNGAEAVDNGADDIETSPWPETWRLDLAGGDAEIAKRFERYSTPPDVGKALIQSLNRIRAGRAVTPQPPDDATDLELRDWRKQVGIPEAPEGYGIAFPEGVRPSEADTAELGQFLEFMHSRHVTPAAAKAAFEFYMTAGKARREAADEAAEEHTRENIADLRNAFGGRREYTRNMSIVNNFLHRHFDSPEENDALTKILALRLPDGVELGNYAPFVRVLAKMAREVASEDDLIGGDGAGGGSSIDDEFRQLAGKVRLTPQEYTRMEELAAARIRREQRAERG